MIFPVGRIEYEQNPQPHVLRYTNSRIPVVKPLQQGVEMPFHVDVVLAQADSDPHPELQITNGGHRFFSKLVKVKPLPDMSGRSTSTHHPR